MAGHEGRAAPQHRLDNRGAPMHTETDGPNVFVPHASPAAPGGGGARQGASALGLVRDLPARLILDAHTKVRPRRRAQTPMERVLRPGWAAPGPSMSGLGVTNSRGSCCGVGRLIRKT